MVIRHGGLTAAERVKKAVEVCKDRCSPYCPYWTEDECRTLILTDCAEAITERDERIAIMQESMEALEKQNEPVKVRHLHNAKVTMHEEVTFTDECGNCGGYLMKNWKACPLCGRSVKWDG